MIGSERGCFSVKRFIGVICCLSILLCACSSQSSTPPASSVPAAPSSASTPSGSSSGPAGEFSQTADGMTYTITKVELQDVVGDRDANNVSAENGEYFALGTDIVKASDWKEIVVSYTIDNVTDAAFGYATLMWEGHLPDGYAVQCDSNLMDLKLMQVPSHGQKKEQLHIYVESSISVSELLLTYHHLDYNEQYFEDFGKIITGEMGQQEYESKYTPTDLKFTVPVPFN